MVLVLNTHNRNPQTHVFYNFTIFIRNTYECCDIYVQTVEPAFTNCSTLVCETLVSPAPQRQPIHKCVLLFFFISTESSAANQTSPYRQRLWLLHSRFSKRAPDDNTFSRPPFCAGMCCQISNWIRSQIFVVLAGTRSVTDLLRRPLRPTATALWDQGGLAAAPVASSSRYFYLFFFGFNANILSQKPEKSRDLSLLNFWQFDSTLGGLEKYLATK